MCIKQMSTVPGITELISPSHTCLSIVAHFQCPCTQRGLVAPLKQPSFPSLSNLGLRNRQLQLSFVARLILQFNICTRIVFYTLWHKHNLKRSSLLPRQRVWQALLWECVHARKGESGAGKKLGHSRREKGKYRL